MTYLTLVTQIFHTAFPGSSVVKNLPASAGATEDTRSVPGSGRSPGEGDGNPVQYSCQDNPMDRGAWLATVHWVWRVRHDWARARAHTHFPYKKQKGCECKERPCVFNVFVNWGGRWSYQKGQLAYQLPA